MPGMKRETEIFVDMILTLLVITGSKETFQFPVIVALIDSIGFWRWFVTLINTGFLDFVHRPEF
jgi:hypothetical protein